MIKKGIHNVRHFIFPTHKNNFHPHLLRETVLLSILLISFFLLGLSFGRYLFLHKTVLGESVESAVLIDLTNESRNKYGLKPLLRNEKLQLAASLKGGDMIENKYFAHYSPEGVSPWYWIKKANYDFIYAGENLAINFLTSKDVESAWLNSPTHRDNILNEKYKDIGISTKVGNFNGRNTVFVIQMFGTEKKINNTKLQSAGATTYSNLQKDEIEKEEAKNIAEKENASASSATNKKDLQVLGISSEEEIKNTENIENNENIKYSTSFDRFIFNFWYKLNFIYKILIILFLLSLISFFFVEFKRHHVRHIIYGAIAIIVLFGLIYINYFIW